MNLPCLSSLTLAAALALAACGASDQRSFAIENLLFETLAATSKPLPAPAAPPDAAQQALVAAGLAAICRGDTGGARQLLDEARIGKDIYQLMLIAAKANRQGSCDYSDWQARRGLLGERFKQLIGSGDGPSVLLAALLDEQLPGDERLAVVQALADRHYGQAQAVLAGLLLRGGGGETATVAAKARQLLSEAAGQGAVPAHLLLARVYRDGLGGAADPAGSCAALREAARLGSATAPRKLAAAGC